MNELERKVEMLFSIRFSRLEAVAAIISFKTIMT